VTHRIRTRDLVAAGMAVAGVAAFPPAAAEAHALPKGHVAIVVRGELGSPFCYPFGGACPYGETVDVAWYSPPRREPEKPSAGPFAFTEEPARSSSMAIGGAFLPDGTSDGLTKACQRTAASTSRSAKLTARRAGE
jgi:hypothetical protein